MNIQQALDMVSMIMRNPDLAISLARQYSPCIAEQALIDHEYSNTVFTAGLVLDRIFMADTAELRTENIIRFAESILIH